MYSSNVIDLLMYIQLLAGILLYFFFLESKNDNSIYCERKCFFSCVTLHCAVFFFVFFFVIMQLCHRRTIFWLTSTVFSIGVDYLIKPCFCGEDRTLFTISSDIHFATLSISCMPPAEQSSTVWLIYLTFYTWFLLSCRF